MGIALGISSSAFKGIIRHHLSQQCMFSRKETGIDSSYDSSKLFTTIPGTYRVILGSAHPDRHDVLVFLLKDIIIYKTQHGKCKKQGKWRLTIVYLWLKPIENTSTLYLI